MFLTTNVTFRAWAPQTYYHKNRGLKRRSTENHGDEQQTKKKKIESLTIDDLPNEMLLEIFTRMDQESLKNSLKTCRKWSQIISSTPSTMTKLPLLIERYDVHNDFGMPKLTRRYSCVTLTDIDEYKPALLRQLTRIGGTVTELNLTDCIFFGNDFTRLLRCFPNVEVLNIAYCTLAVPPSRKMKLFELKKLQKLCLSGEGWMLPLISCKLIELSVSNFFHEDQPELIVFLNDQASLESLSLDNVLDLFCQRYHHEKIHLDFKFQLKSLYLNSLPYADGDHMLTLLRHAENCELVSLGYELNRVVGEHVLKNFKKMISLDIDSDLIPNYPRFYYNMKTNLELKSMKISGEFEEIEYFMSLIKKLPNLEHLDVRDLGGLQSTNANLWTEMTTLLPNLSYLGIERLNVFNLPLLKFPMLRKLETMVLGYTLEKLWRTFGTKNPILESLIIHSAPFYKFLQKLDLMRNLKSLHRLEYCRPEY